VEVRLPDAVKRLNNMVGVRPKSQRIRVPPHSGQGSGAICCIASTTLSTVFFEHEFLYWVGNSLRILPHPLPGIVYNIYKNSLEGKYMLDFTLFDYDQAAPLDLEVISTQHRDGTAVEDITYDSPKGGKVPVYLIVPSGNGSFAG